MAYDKGKDFLNLFEFDLSRHKKVIDIGGNDGSFAIHLANKYPKISFEVYDLQEVRDVFDKASSNLNYPLNLSFSEGDFLRNRDLPKADAFTCGFILHDWPDFVSEKIIKMAHRALSEGGLLILHEHLLDHPDQTVRAQLALEHYNMVTLGLGTNLAAGEKSSVEYRVWLKKMGFIVEDIQYGKSVSVLVCRKTEKT